ncbi:MAG: hypothetical protein Q8N18_00355 [Opitutaceae bacterium]|nr:hypothetical protein [Opitutaceae bacterium]
MPSVLEAQQRKLRSEVGELAASSLSTSQFAATEQRLLTRFSIETFEIDWANETVAKEEVMEERPSDLGRGRTFKRQEIVLRITAPFTGDRNLIQFSPVSFVNNAPRAYVREMSLEFVYQRAQQELAKLRPDHDENVRMIKNSVTQINDLLAKFHEQLPVQLRQLLEARRDQLNVVDTQLADLGFNIRRHEGPAPVSFPVTRKQIIQPLPPVAKAGTPAYRVLEQRHYDEILAFLTNMSLGVERSPSTFGETGEEALRDWFLVALNGTFRGDATGETFNREGKTDIAIRVDGNVIFIAECKFWGGEKVLLATIDQLLGYLTWRDSKAGILIFSRNADFTAVLKQIRDVVAKHPNFVRHLPYSTETGFRFLVRNKTDKEREHVVTLLAFHIPKV